MQPLHFYLQILVLVSSAKRTTVVHHWVLSSSPIARWSDRRRVGHCFYLHHRRSLMEQHQKIGFLRIWVWAVDNESNFWPSCASVVPAELFKCNHHCLYVSFLWSIGAFTLNFRVTFFVSLRKEPFLTSTDNSYK